MCLAVASALDLTEHSAGVHPLFKDATPKAWRNAKFSYIEEKETIVESVRRMLGHWMGFDKVRGHGCPYSLSLSVGDYSL